MPLNKWRVIAHSESHMKSTLWHVPKDALKGMNTMNKNLLIKLTVLTISISALINIFAQVVLIPELGDGRLIALIMSNPDLFPAVKYLVGIEMLRVGYSAIWQFPPIASLLPESISNHAGFMRVTGIIAMAGIATTLLHIYKNKYSILFAITTPVWILFSAGYLEYYPFIAGIFLALLCWLFHGRLEDKSEIWIGVICGALPLIYIGFAPLSVIILITYLWGAHTTKTTSTLGALLLGFFITLRVFWPNSLAEYFVSLYQDMNFGDQNTVYEGYRGLAASDTSIFFNNHYAWSSLHLKELFHMAALGLGLVPIVILLATLLVHRREIFSVTREVILAALILAFTLLYFIYTIPKLGPIIDVDMFFITYITVAFFAGMALDARKVLRPRMALSLHCINTAISLWLLLGITIA